MSQENTTTDTASKTIANQNDLPDHVYLVSYPKIVYLYPTVITALFCGIFMWAKGGIPPEEIRMTAIQKQAVAQLRHRDVRRSAPLARAGIGAQADETGTNPTEIPEVSTPAAADSAATLEPPTDAANAGGKANSTPSDSTDGNPKDPTDVNEANQHTYHNVCARVFLVVVALNLVVIAFDFPRTTSLTWFFAIVAIVIGMWFLLTLNRNLAPQIVSVLLKIKPAANASFYLIFSGIMIFLYLGVLVSRRFDFWEVKGNELLHHHGFLSNLERFSAPNLRIDKEINDVFEYMLLKSGRLIIHASNERRAIVLENVLFINDKEERITKMLGALQVRVRTDRE
ncbi:MAG: hypothetical protein O2856_13575 [Planctomycetota bacterium]|nr:hypothetical protein [Planctomycetota bacterium]